MLSVLLCPGKMCRRIAGTSNTQLCLLCTRQVCRVHQKGLRGTCQQHTANILLYLHPSRSHLHTRISECYLLLWQRCWRWLGRTCTSCPTNEQLSCIGPMGNCSSRPHSWFRNTRAAVPLDTSRTTSSRHYRRWSCTGRGRIGRKRSHSSCRPRAHTQPGTTWSRRTSRSTRYRPP